METISGLFERVEEIPAKALFRGASTRLFDKLSSSNVDDSEAAIQQLAAIMCRNMVPYLGPLACEPFVSEVALEPVDHFSIIQ